MRHAQPVVILLAALVASAGVLMPSMASIFGVTVVTAAQDPASVEAALGLDRPTRRVLQQGLRHEGFDPGVPDGLFGPRTRAAIRAWQAAREETRTGYLDSDQAAVLRAAAVPRPVTAPPELRNPTSDCAAWYTREYFRTATVNEVTACLDAAADANARDSFGIMPLHWAAQFNANAAVLETLLAAGADVGARDHFVGYTPLHRAARYNTNPAVLEVLITAGADVGARNDDGFTALHLAARYNANPAVLDILLAAGAEIEDRDRAGLTPLQHAAYAGKLGAVEVLVGAGADLEMKGATLLQYAARAGHLGAVEALLAAGADPAGALHGAVHHGAAMVKALIAAGADIEEPTGRTLHSAGGRTPLHLAVRYPEVTTVLLGAGADVNARERDHECTPLHYATRAAAAKVLLDAGADVNARCRDGYTPLHTLFWDRYSVDDRGWLHSSSPHGAPPPAADVIEILIAAGADWNARTDRLETPLHYAATSRGGPDVVLPLLAAGADVDATDDLGRTPLYWAAEHNENPAVIEALLAAGADVEARADRGWTPLLEAVESNEIVVIEALLAAGADVATRDRYGRTPLHKTRDSEVIRALLAAGASVDARDEDGNTPLHIATKAYSKLSARGDGIEALLEAGADPTMGNAIGKTPWDLAEENDALKGSDAYWSLNEARLPVAR